MRKVAHKVFDDIPMRVDSWWFPISQTIKKTLQKSMVELLRVELVEQS